nr:MAG TPA: head tail connector [Caudoviricetes sp.]
MVDDINVNDVAEYIRLAEVSEEDKALLTKLIAISKQFISNYTGIPIKSTDENVKVLNDFDDFVIVVYILCQDMYDNRTMYVDKTNLNKVVETILGMHSRNLL